LKKGPDNRIYKLLQQKVCIFPQLRNTDHDPNKKMKSLGVHILNSLFRRFPVNNSAKKGPWHWDKSTAIKEGADALLLLERKASMSLG